MKDLKKDVMLDFIDGDKGMEIRSKKEYTSKETEARKFSAWLQHDGKEEKVEDTMKNIS